MGWKVVRTFEDFRWLHESLKNRFPANYIPEIPEVQAVESARELDKFYLATYINQVVASADLVYSPELVSFLKLADKDFSVSKKVSLPYSRPPLPLSLRKPGTFSISTKTGP